MVNKSISVIGAGSWGTALSILLANNGYNLVNDKYTHNTFNEKLSKILEL